MPDSWYLPVHAVQLIIDNLLLHGLIYLWLIDGCLLLCRLSLQLFDNSLLSGLNQKQPIEIKSALINDGWKIKIGDSSLNETGAQTSEVNTTTKVKYDTAYRMYMTTTLSRNSNHGITRFNISIVDNKNNEEVLNMAGNREDYVRYKPEIIAKNLINNLNELQGDMPSR